jgi:hypothetical protein
MGFLSRLFGGDESDQGREQPRRRGEGPGREQLSDDERAIERYRYLLRTAPPETIEQAHAEAFSQLTPEQRRLVLEELTREMPERERAAVRGDDPQSLARVATRAEVRQPGTLERTFGGFSAPGMGGIGVGGLFAGSFLSSIAGVMLGSAIANQFFNDSGYDDASSEGNQDAETGDSGDQGDSASGDGAASDASGDYGDGGGFGGDVGGGDFGGDFGGGDFGGGDFGGSEF